MDFVQIGKNLVFSMYESSFITDLYMYICVISFIKVISFIIVMYGKLDRIPYLSEHIILFVSNIRCIITYGQSSSFFFFFYIFLVSKRDVRLGGKSSLVDWVANLLQFYVIYMIIINWTSYTISMNVFYVLLKLEHYNKNLKQYWKQMILIV